jgi:hypothetical protein
LTLKLHQLTSSLYLIALGDGGMAEPYRYFIHPVMIGMLEKREARALQKAFKADGGAEQASAVAMMQMFSAPSRSRRS